MPVFKYKDSLVDKGDWLNSRLKESSPSDYFFLTRQEDLYLMDLWEDPTAGKISIPSDLFFSKTVPLMDCEISIDETAEDWPDVQGAVAKFRVCIFPDYEQNIDKLMCDGSTDGLIVGAIELYVPGSIYKVHVPIVVSAFSNYCAYAGLAVYPPTIPDEVYARIIDEGNVSGFFCASLETWYGIQIALLHPQTKEIFKCPVNAVVRESGENSAKRKKRRVRYVRKHYLSIGELEGDSNSTGEKKRKFKCLAWYVIGHWRILKNGTKIFIKPYWKGPLRKTKRNADGDPRERLI